jgi:hypothetical protein
MPFEVFLSDSAAQDLKDLYDYIEGRDAPGMADQVLEQFPPCNPWGIYSVVRDHEGRKTTSP